MNLTFLDPFPISVAHRLVLGWRRPMKATAEPSVSREDRHLYIVKLRVGPVLMNERATIKERIHAMKFKLFSVMRCLSAFGWKR